MDPVTRKPSAGAVVLVAATLVLFLQARFLHLAAAPGTDEGVFAIAGTMMMQGLRPHRDFGIWHMPLMPLAIGGGLEVFGGMYPLRLLYLGVNSFVVVPLFVAFRRLHASGPAALLAVSFYLTFHEMVHHDFRWRPW